MTYVAYSRAQIESVLPPGWELANMGGCWEYVYRWTSKKGNWHIVCYSGLDQRTGRSRAKGTDAIRFALVDVVSGKGIGKVERVHRTGTEATLKGRLQDRFDRLVALGRVEEQHRCRKCGAATVVRKNKKGEEFRGCSAWPNCGRVSDVRSESQEAIDIVQQAQISTQVPPREMVRTGRSIDGVEPEPSNVSRMPEGRGTKGRGTKDFPHLTFPFREFNPVQSQALPYVEKDVNLVVASPTSSGKTVIAEMVIAVALAQGRKGIFTSPLKALTQEKLDSWRTQWLDKAVPPGVKPAFQGKRIEIVTGDYQLTEKRVKDLMLADVIAMTSEMLDSRTRRMEREKNVWLYEVGVLVVDEAHMITMEDRGHPIEAGIMRFTQQNPKARVVLLSATMPNVQDLGAWLTSLNGKESVIVQSEWRPVPHQVHYVPHPDRGNYWYVEDAKMRRILELLQEYPDDRWLIFVHTKSMGRNLLKVLTEDLGMEAEFHSADLDKKERLRIEAAFRERR